MRRIGQMAASLLVGSSIVVVVNLIVVVVIVVVVNLISRQFQLLAEDARAIHELL
jgi:hypothetical protein